MGYALASTPAGRLLRRSAREQDRPALFAAQFALSHACWLVTYPLAGWGGVALGLPATALVLAVVAMLGITLADGLWPSTESDALPHAHPDLLPDHPHLRPTHGTERHRHAHAVVIDDLHPRWPSTS